MIEDWNNNIKLEQSRRRLIETRNPSANVLMDIDEKPSN